MLFYLFLKVLEISWLTLVLITRLRWLNQLFRDHDFCSTFREATLH
jgi:hypothetical protein